MHLLPPNIMHQPFTVREGNNWAWGVVAPAAICEVGRAHEFHLQLVASGLGVWADPSFRLAVRVLYVIVSRIISEVSRDYYRISRSKLAERKKNQYLLIMDYGEYIRV